MQPEATAKALDRPVRPLQPRQRARGGADAHAQGGNVASDDLVAKRFRQAEMRRAQRR